MEKAADKLVEDWEREMDEVVNLRDKMEDKEWNKMVHGLEEEVVGGGEGEFLRKSN